MRLCYLLLLIVNIVFFSSCSLVNKNIKQSWSYADLAKQIYNEGLTYFKARDYKDAAAKFEEVKNKYSYSKYAIKAELKIADCYYGEGDFLQAAEMYKLFTHFHPANEQVQYATFQAAKSSFNLLPSNFFLFTPRYKKDMSIAHDALRDVENYLTHFPDGEFNNQAKQYQRMIFDIIIKHNIYIAQFYAKRKKWHGALGRYKYVIDNFSDNPLVKEALVESIKIYKVHLHNEVAANKLHKKMNKLSGLK